MAEWDIFKVGSLAGLASFAWLFIKDTVKWYKKPRLEILFSKDKDLRIYLNAESGVSRKVATLHIRNKRMDTAKRCVALLRVTKKPDTATLLEDECALHWAETPYSVRTAGAEPIDIGPELARLDVAFAEEKKNPGCWLARPFSLIGNLTINQAYLEPAEYEVAIEVKCENGIGDKANFIITSPNIWEELDFNQLK